MWQITPTECINLHTNSIFHGIIGSSVHKLFLFCLSMSFFTELWNVRTSITKVSLVWKPADSLTEVLNLTPFMAPEKILIGNWKMFQILFSLLECCKLLVHSNQASGTLAAYNVVFAGLQLLIPIHRITRSIKNKKERRRWERRDWVWAEHMNLATSMINEGPLCKIRICILEFVF